MTTVAGNIVRSLENVLNKECKLYKQYISILQEERSYITNFDADKLTALTAKRAALYDDMLLAQDERLQLMRSFPNNTNQKLRDLISLHLSKADQAVLSPLAEELRNLVLLAQKESKEQNQIVKFGLKMVHGVLSLFWSATQNVVRSYSRKGDIRENYNSTTRDNNLLKKA
jgi:hypothetical protein